MRGGRSEHHALDVRVGEVERRQTTDAKRGASAFHDVLRAGRARTGRVIVQSREHKDVPGIEVT